MTTTYSVLANSASDKTANIIASQLIAARLTQELQKAPVGAIAQALTSGEEGIPANHAYDFFIGTTVPVLNVTSPINYLLWLLTTNIDTTMNRKALPSYQQDILTAVENEDEAEFDFLHAVDPQFYNVLIKLVMELDTLQGTRYDLSSNGNVSLLGALFILCIKGILDVDFTGNTTGSTEGLASNISQFIAKYFDGTQENFGDLVDSVTRHLVLSATTPNSLQGLATQPQTENELKIRADYTAKQQPQQGKIPVYTPQAKHFAVLERLHAQQQQPRGINQMPDSCDEHKAMLAQVQSQQGQFARFDESLHAMQQSRVAFQGLKDNTQQILDQQLRQPQACTMAGPSWNHQQPMASTLTEALAQIQAQIQVLQNLQHHTNGMVSVPVNNTNHQFLQQSQVGAGCLDQSIYNAMCLIQSMPKTTIMEAFCYLARHSTPNMPSFTKAFTATYVTFDGIELSAKFGYLELLAMFIVATITNRGQLRIDDHSFYAGADFNQILSPSFQHITKALINLQ